jgi:hypothetical protein
VLDAQSVLDTPKPSHDSVASPRGEAERDG